MMVAGALTTQAENYAYFVIEQNNGTSLSMPAVGLNISYSDGNLVATNGTEHATIQLTNVSRMYFSNEKTATAIEATAADDRLSVRTGLLSQHSDSQEYLPLL